MARKQLQVLDFNHLFKLSLVYSLLLLSSSTFASSGITYHGKILKPDGVTAVNSATTQFRIQVRTPGTENCLLWEEQQTKDLSNTGGVFTITIADSAEPTLISNSLPFSLERVFSNRSSFTGLTNCSSGTSYTPSTSIDGRNLQVFFKENPADPWEQMPATKVNFVPLALNSVQLEGYLAAEFLKIDPYTNQTPLSNTQVDTLVDLVSGTSGVFARISDSVMKSQAFSGDVSGVYSSTSVDRIKGISVSGAPTAGQILKFDGTSWVPSADATGSSPGDATYAAKGLVQINTDQATSGLFIASGVLALPNLMTAGSVGSASSVPTINYDAKGRITSVSANTVDDTSKLPLAGGTMSGSIDMGTRNITNATSLASTNVSTRNLILADATTNTITVKAPAAVTTYDLTLPATAGTNGYVLSTNGSGVTSWIPAATGSVTSVSSGNSYLTVTGTSTPVITANVGVAANTLAAGDDSRIVNAVQAAAYAADLAPAALCTTTQTPYWNTVSDVWACQTIGSIASAVSFSGTLSGDVSGTQGATSVDKIKGRDIAAATTAHQLMIYNGAAWVNNVVSGDATLLSTGALTLKNTGTAGTYYKVVTDAQGRVTSGSGLVSGDITTALGYEPLNKAGDTMTGTLGLNAVAADPAGLLVADRGKVWYNTTTSQIKFWDGATAIALGVSGAGLTSLGGQTGSTQTFAVDALGLTPAINSGSNTHTLSIPLASGAGVTSGTISKTDYDNFSAKLGSAVTSVNVTVPAYMTTSGGPITTSGDITLGFGSQSAKSFFAAPQGSVGAPAFRAMNIADLQSTVAGSFLTGGTCGAGAALVYSSVTDTISCSGIVPTISNVATLNDGKIWMGDVAHKAQEVSVSGDATLASTGILTLKNTGTAGTYRSVTTDAQGRVTAGTNPTTLAGYGITDGFVNGGNSFGANATLGTGDAYDLGFKTNNTTKMTIQSGGNVGIGTTGPTAKLDVNGTGNFSDVLSFPGAVGTSPGLRFNSLGTATSYGTNLGFGLDTGWNIVAAVANVGFRMVANGGATPWAMTNNGNTTQTGTLTVQGAGNSSFVGNVGIGTASPGTLLDVAGTATLGVTGARATLSSWYSNSAFWIDLPTTGPSGIGSGGAGANAWIGYVRNNGNWIGDSTAGDIAYRNTSGRMLFGNGGNTVMSVYGNRVGIGTPNPGSLLDVNGEIAVRGMSAPSVSGAGTGRIYFDSTANVFRVSQNGGTYVNLVGTSDFANGGNTFAGIANLGTNDNFALNFKTNNTTKMTILPSGFVGFGNSSPGYTVDVSGDISATGCLRSSAGVSSGSCVSDARLKTDVKTFDLGLESLMGIQPKYFKYNGLGEHPKSEQLELGVIAQDVEKTAPDLVQTRKVKLHADDQELTEIKQVNYTAFSYVLINSVKQLYYKVVGIDREIASVKAENEKLKSENAQIKAYLCSKDPDASICESKP